MKKKAKKATQKKTPKKDISRSDVKLDIKSIKKLLLEKKSEIIEKMKIQSEYENINERDIGDEIDDVVQTVEKELKFDISATEKNILNEIELALKKIEEGRYGICELCKKPIEPKRLMAIPYSRYCIECQKKHYKA